MFEVKETWAELGPQGRMVTRKRVEFGSIMEQVLFLRKMVNVWRGTEWARQLAMQIITEARCADRNKACYALAIGEAVQARVRYVNEFPETFQTPRYTWDNAFGDCDDHTTLIATLVEALGIECDVVGLKCNDQWRHVFAMARIPTGPGRTRPMFLDTTLRNTPVREFANPVTRARARGLKCETFIPPRNLM